MNVILPPDEGLLEVTVRPDIAEARGRKKRRLNGDSEKEKRMCKRGHEYLKAGYITMCET